MGMETGEDDAMIVRSTIDLADNLGLTVVAEGVETAAIQDRLRALACDEAQGYHIARPLPVDDFLAWPGRPARGSWCQAVASQFWVRAVHRRKYPQCLPPPLARLRALPPLQPPTLAAHRLLRQPPVGPCCAARP